MVDYSNCKIEKLTVHYIGNKTNEEAINVSNGLLDIPDNKIEELLLRYFLTPFSYPEFYSFTFADDDFSLNPMFNFAMQIFADSEVLQKTSIDIANHLYELSVHPQIKSGDLFIVYFTNIKINDETTEAIGIFKSENKQEFLKLENSRNNFTLSCDDGINIDKLDKGCLIFNCELDRGFNVCVLDKSSKSTEAQFWKDSFLQIKPLNDDYHNTKKLMVLTKDFVTQQLADEYELSRADQINYLNKSADYFKTHQKFQKNDFEKEVFGNDKVIRSFRNYKDDYPDDFNYDDFEISSNAVKKQLKIYKSVLKLDNNFHIYIHGNREMIEHGVEKDGRQFYKIYYMNEK